MPSRTVARRHKISTVKQHRLGQSRDRGVLHILHQIASAALARVDRLTADEGIKRRRESSQIQSKGLKTFDSGVFASFQLDAATTHSGGGRSSRRHQIQAIVTCPHPAAG